MESVRQLQVSLQALPITTDSDQCITSYTRIYINSLDLFWDLAGDLKLY